jgi:hypothetical protein
LTTGEPVEQAFEIHRDFSRQRVDIGVINLADLVASGAPVYLDDTVSVRLHRGALQRTARLGLDRGLAAKTARRNRRRSSGEKSLDLRNKSGPNSRAIPLPPRRPWPIN